MALSIRWSAKAKKTYESILIYLTENWSDKEVDAFINKVEDSLKIISEHPEAFKASAYHNIRKSVLGKQNSLFYQIRNSEIFLLLFWDNRMDPRKKKY